MRYALTLPRLVCTILLLAGVSVAPSRAAESAINDSAALAGVEVARGIFLIDFTNPKKTAFYFDRRRPV